MCASVRACVFVCVCACMLEHVRARMRMCVCVSVCVFKPLRDCTITQSRLISEQGIRSHQSELTVLLGVLLHCG